MLHTIQSKSILLLCAVALAACTPKPKELLLVGSYSDGATPGISVYDFDTETGEYEKISELTGILNPSYLVVSPDERRVYSVSETGEGAVTAFAFDPKNGTLQAIHSQPTEGADPCYININSERTFAVTANYNGGNLSVFPLDANGNLKPMTQNIAFSPGSHIHTAVFSPDEKYLLVTDLGQDKIFVFNVLTPENDTFIQLDSSRTVCLEPGSGPRHLVFHPNGKFLYCINELSGKVTAFAYHDGRAAEIQSIASDTTPGVGGKGSADIHLTPDGRFLYASNRLQADGIAVFSVHPETGWLTQTAYQPTGIHPRNFLISANGKFLLCANRDSNSVQIFRIHPKTGELQATGKEIRLDKPVCLKWGK